MSKRWNYCYFFAIVFVLFFGQAQARILPKKYDYIVVGAGTAGSIIGARLSEDPTKNVLVIGSGVDTYTSGFNQLPFLNPQDTAGYPTDLPFFVDYSYSVEGPNITYRSNPVVRPHTFGGGSMINGAVFQRPYDVDYDNLASLGITGWSSAHMGELWKNIERYMPWNSNNVPVGHGINGPVQTRAIPPEALLSLAINSLGNTVGAEYIPDMGLGNINGTGIFVRSLGGNSSSTATGKYYRQDSYTTYLKPVLNRKNLNVVGGAVVTDVSRRGACGRLSDCGACVNTVTYTLKGREYSASVRVGGEIILSAGVFESPRILFHSGIGDCNFLATMGVSCTHNNPNIAKNVYDHLQITQAFLTVPSPNWSSNIGSIVGTYYSANRTDGVINIETAMTSLPTDVGQAIIALNALTKPLSHGELKLRDSDWSSPLYTTFGVMNDSSDFAPLITAFKNTRLAIANAGLPFFVEIAPGYQAVPLDASDDVILEYIRGEVKTVFHTVGSTPMGLCSAGATVDDKLRVCGVSGLRIADNGIMPYSYTGHTTDAGARLIGEQAVHLINQGLTQ